MATDGSAIKAGHKVVAKIGDGSGRRLQAPRARLGNDLAGVAFRVLHTPGHSPGGITLYQPESALALVGDTLFAGSIGRTDFPGSSARTLEHSIRTHLYSLPPATRVLPGHGPETTVERERRTNPFVRG